MRVRAYLAAAFVLAAAAGGGPSSLGAAGPERQDPAAAAPGCALSSTAVAPGRLGVELLAEVANEGSVGAVISPLGVRTVLAMLAQGATSPVRGAIREITGMRGGKPATAGAAITPGAAPGVRDEDGKNSSGPDNGGPEGGAPGSAVADDAALHCRIAAARIGAQDDAGIELRIANGVFADRRLDVYPGFSATLRDRFGAHVERLGFGEADALERINGWAAQVTGGAIPRLLSQLDPDEGLVLANALHFRGLWAHPFDPARTAPLPFHRQSGETVAVATMRADEHPARYRQDEDFQAIGLAYGDGAFEFVAVLPRPGLEAAAALGKLASDPSWLGGAGFANARGYLALPRMTLEGETALLPVLHALGLKSAMRDADAFAGIAMPPPRLSRVVQRTRLVLDERGTEAAAATAAVMTTRAAIPEESVFDIRLERPFALAVRHRRTGALLFTAWVADPAAGAQP